MAIALDTLAYARRLQEAGFSEEQAEGQARALAAAMTDSLATKDDLRELEVRVEARFAIVDERFVHAERHLDTRLAEMMVRFDGKLTELEHRMTMRLGAMTVAGIGVVSLIAGLA